LTDHVISQIVGLHEAATCRIKQILLGHWLY